MGGLTLVTQAVEGLGTSQVGRDQQEVIVYLLISSRSQLKMENLWSPFVAISSMTLATSSLTYAVRGPVTHAAKLVLVARSSLILWVPVQ